MLDAWDFLKKAFETRSVASSYLFVGDKEGRGEAFVRGFVQIFFCEGEGERPCLQCKACQRIEKGKHPSLFFLNGEKATVSDIRETIGFVSLKSSPREYRFVLIRSIADLHRGSANALLKIFEEPPKNLVFLSLTNDILRVLPTIRSRSQIIRLPYLSHSCLKKEQSTLLSTMMDLLFLRERGFLSKEKFFGDRLKSREMLHTLEEIGRAMYFKKIGNRSGEDLPHVEEISLFLQGRSRETLRLFLIRIAKAEMLLGRNISPSLLFDQIFMNL